MKPKIEDDVAPSEKNLGSETPLASEPTRQDAATILLQPVTLAQANEFVALLHRHHKPVVGHKFSIGIANGHLRGVVIVGRPVSRHQDDGATLEVTRCCTDGVRNGCSMLYRAAWRVASNLGFQRLITYTLPQEGGASLRAAGFKLLGIRRGGNWNVASRPRVDTAEHLRGQKLLWELNDRTQRARTGNLTL